ncbi:MAG: aspartate aminotransferase family protein [Chloroflexota bacterium]
MTAAATARRRPASDRLVDEARQRLPGGVDSNVRLDGTAVFFARGDGAWLWDVDGNDYVDFLLGQGPAFLGHAPAQVVEAVGAAVQNGMVYGAQHPLELDVAERICLVLRWPEMVRFGSSGTEMVQAALRLARAATGRKKVIRFEGHYHGWLDNVLLAIGPDGPEAASAGQLEEHLRELIVLPWNDLAAVTATFDEHGDEVAAVIMEPVMMNAGAIEPAEGYLAGVRDLCGRSDSVLIFDEIITGFRIALGGAAERYGVTPDLATYGKAMAGSWPVAALAGRADLMERFGTGEVTHAGTFNANVMGMAATDSTLRILEAEPPYERLAVIGGTLMDGLQELGQRFSLPLHVQGLPMAFHVSFGEADATDYRSLQALDATRYRSLAEQLVDHGVWVARRGIWYLSAAHGVREVEVALERSEAALSGL